MLEVSLRVLIIRLMLTVALGHISLGADGDVLRCGLRNGSDSWPFHVGLYHRDRASTNSFYFCGGTIVSHRHVLVAAHCVVPHPAEMISVRYGAKDLAEPEETRRGLVEKIILHPGYRAPDFSQDIGLLQLLEMIPIGELAQPVCLLPPINVSTSVDLEGDRGTSIGWGVGPRNIYSHQLRVATVDVRRRSSCMDVFDPKLFETNEFFCAVTPVCVGSGGSGFYLTIQNRFYLQGMTTFGQKDKSEYECGLNRLTGLLNVAMYSDWIKEQTSTETNSFNELDSTIVCNNTSVP